MCDSKALHGSPLYNGACSQEGRDEEEYEKFIFRYRKGKDIVRGPKRLREARITFIESNDRH